jgi:hypothetical protein
MGTQMITTLSEFCILHVQLIMTPSSYEIRESMEILIKVEPAQLGPIDRASLSPHPKTGTESGL